MHFSAATVLAFAAAAVAQTQGFDSISKPAAGEAIAAGSSFTVAWTAPEKYKDGTVSIELVGGKDAASLVPLSKVASNVKNSDGTYTWKVDSSLGKDKAYGLKFVWDKDTSVYQWSNGFSIKASGDQASGSGSASGTASQASKTDSQSGTTAAASATSGSVSGSASASASNSGSSSGTISGTISGTSSGTVSGSSASASASSVTGSATQSGATTLVQSPSSSGSAAASTTPARTSSSTTTTSGRSPTATGGAAAVHAGSLTVLGLVAAALAL